MVTYIIRRLIGAVVLLFVVSVITFAIFFLVPRLAGATPETLASRYVGQAADAGAGRRRPRSRLGFTDPLLRAVRALGQGRSSSAPTTTTAPASSTARRRASATRSSPRQPVWPDLLDRLPVTLSLAVGAAVIWLVVGVATGVHLGAATRQRLRPGGDGRSRSPVCRCRSSSPACSRWSIFSYTLQLDRARRHRTRRSRENPLEWAYDLILPWITLAFLFAAGVRPAHPGRHARDDGRGLHPHRPGQGPAASATVVVKHGLRAALTPIVTIFGLDLGLLLGGASSPRARSRCRASGKYAVDAITNQRPAQGAGRDADRRVLHRHGEPDRRPALRASSTRE